MKRILSLIILILIIIQCLGCSKNQISNKNIETKGKSEATYGEKKNKEGGNNSSSNNEKVKDADDGETEKLGNDTKALMKEIDSILDSLDEAEGVDTN